MKFPIPEVIAKVADPDGAFVARLESGEFGKNSYRSRTVRSGLLLYLESATDLSGLDDGCVPERIVYRRPVFLPPQTRFALQGVETAGPDWGQVVCAVGGGPLKAVRYYQAPSRAPRGEPDAVFSVPEILIVVLANSQGYCSVVEHKLSSPSVADLVHDLKLLFRSGPIGTLAKTYRRYQEAAYAALRKAEGNERGQAYYFRPD